MVENGILSYPLIIALVVILALSGTFLGVEKAWADSVIATIPLSSTVAFPFGVAFDSANGDIYVTDFGINTVSVIDGSTNKVINDIAVGDRPLGVAFDSDNGDIYVANSGSRSNSISVIDGSTNKVIDNIQVDSNPRGIAFDSNNGNLYVANQGSNTVSAIDGSTNKVIDTISVGGPQGVAFNKANADIYVTASTNTYHNVFKIDGSTNKVIDTISVGECPEGLAFDSTDNDIYVANQCSNTVSVTIRHLLNSKRELKSISEQNGSN